MNQIKRRPDNNRFRHRLWTIATTLSVLLIVGATLVGIRAAPYFFITPDQLGERLARVGNWEEAAGQYEDPFRKGVALYRSGQFEEAANVFGFLPGAEAAFNQANSLLMHGQYEQSIGRYDRALQLRPGWSAALTNREIATARRDRLKIDAGNMTGGELGADDIVFDNSPQNSGTENDQTETIDAAQLDSPELGAVWLRQVQTTPAQFLKAKFAYQLVDQDPPPPPRAKD